METGATICWYAVWYSVLWCFAHSFLLHGRSRKLLAGRFSFAAPYSRICYNLFAAVSLIPLLYLLRQDQSATFFVWEGFGNILRAIMLISALGCFYFGSRAYDFNTFIGLSQIRNGQDRVLISKDQRFTRNGIHGVIRHPWYAGGMLLLWSIWEEYSLLVFMVYSVFSSYFIIGAWLEEKRLLREFGRGYQDYMDEVSMFIPVKWLKRKIEDKI